MSPTSRSVALVPAVAAMLLASCGRQGPPHLATLAPGQVPSHWLQIEWIMTPRYAISTKDDPRAVEQFHAMITRPFEQDVPERQAYYWFPPVTSRPFAVALTDGSVLLGDSVRLACNRLYASWLRDLDQYWAPAATEANPSPSMCLAASGFEITKVLRPEEGEWVAPSQEETHMLRPLVVSILTRCPRVVVGAPHDGPPTDLGASDDPHPLCIIRLAQPARILRCAVAWDAYEFDRHSDKLSEKPVTKVGRAVETGCDDVAIRMWERFGETRADVYFHEAGTGHWWYAGIGPPAPERAL
jgi:hypothetical protein